MNYSKVLLFLCWMLFTFSACKENSNESALNTAEKKELVSKFIEMMEVKAFERFGEIIADDYKQHNPMVKQGLKGIQEGASWFLNVFPDLSASIDEVVVEGDLIVARITWTGTHSAELFGIPASGVKASWVGTDWWRVKDGKLIEHWDVVDWSGLINQLSKKNHDS